MFENLFDLMMMILLMIVAGYILQKTGMVSDAGKKSLANILIYLVLPCNIVKVFYAEFSVGELMSMSMVLVIAILIQLFYIVLTKILYRRFENGEKQVYQYATVCSNSGFLGYPLSQGVFGDLGLLYASVFMIPQRIVMWTAGITYFTKASGKLAALKKVVLHPCMVAVYLGVILMLTQWQLPDFLDDTLSGLSSCCTGMTMVYIGTVLAEVDLRTITSKKQIYFAAFRLVLIPLAVYLCCLAFQVEPLITGVCVLLTAMPAGSTTAILAAQYDGDEVTAVKCVVFTTAVSVVTIPIWSIILTHGLYF